MENKKKLKINAAQVNLIATREESIAPYSSIEINAASIMLSPETQTLLSRFGAKMNAAAIAIVPKGCKFININGEHTLSAASVASEPTALNINGTLLITPGAEEAVASYAKITVNGLVYAPEKSRSLIGEIVINGGTQYYPDGYALIRGDLIVDKTFLLRMKEGDCFYITGKLLMTDDSISADDLMKKSPRFRAKRAFVRASLENAIPLIDEETPLDLIPEGFTVCPSALRLGEDTVPRYGKSIYVLEDFFAEKDSLPYLDAIERLMVLGTAKIPEADKGAYLSKLKKFAELFFYKGTLVYDEGNLHVTGEWLTEYEDGVTIEDCGAVEIDPAIDLELLRDKLRAVHNCGAVLSSQAHLGLLQKRALNCGHVGLRKDRAHTDDDTVVINAATYEL